jgi:peptidylprolyl isomerase
MRSLRRARLIGSVALSVALLFGAAACGGQDGDAAAGGCDVQIGTDLAAKPSVKIPECATKPGRAQIKDVVPGSGTQAREGDAVSVKYVGVSWSTGDEFDASWKGGPDKTFEVSPLGRASVIAGWNQGLVGARVGSRRLLILPPDLGYGASGQGPIGPNETLIFVVDVVSITPGTAATPS